MNLRITVMNRKKIRLYFSKEIEKEKIPPFEKVRPLLKETSAPAGGKGKPAFVFYSLFAGLASCIIIAGFTYKPVFTGHIVTGYRESNFARHAEEKIKKAEDYLSHLEKFRKGEQ